MTTVLLLEDDEAIGDAIASLLEEEGHVVVWARDGQIALERLRSGPRPDLILLDLAMPVMDGFHFRAEQRLQPALASIPVVVCTADGHGDEAARVLDAAGFLRKPLDAEKLLELVSSFGPPTAGGGRAETATGL